MAEKMFDESLILEKDRKAREKELDKFNHMTRLSLIPGIIVMLAIAAYIVAMPQEERSEIIIQTNIVQNIETDENTGIGRYENEDLQTFKIIPLDNLSFFENNRMDRLFATAAYNDKKDTLWLLVRGIRYDELPYIYDYYEEFEKPDAENGFTYRTMGTSLKIRGETRQILHLLSPLEDQMASSGIKYGQFSYKFQNDKNADSKKDISIQYVRVKSSANHLAFAVFGGVITFIATFIILMNRKNNK